MIGFSRRAFLKKSAKITAALGMGFSLGAGYGYANPEEPEVESAPPATRAPLKPRIPQGVVSLLESEGIRIVISYVGADGAVNAVPKGRVYVVDDHTLAFIDMVKPTLKTEFKPNDKAAIYASSKDFHFSGYQIKGTFQEYQVSGDLYDQFPAGDLVQVGLIKVDEVYSFVEGGVHGARIV